MHDYQTKGYSQYGASMGRAYDHSFDCFGTLTIRKVPLDGGGYDPGGAYWGTPDNLYLVSDKDGLSHYLRAADVGAAKAEFPHATWESIQEISESDIDDMVDGYLTCALWSSNDESEESGGNPLDDNYSSDDVAKETREKMWRDCYRFAHDNRDALIACLESDKHSIDWSRIGHDFWLTRNGHGCGFWDGDYPEPHATTLTDASRKMGETYLYVGDDGKVRG